MATSQTYALILGFWWSLKGKRFSKQNFPTETRPFSPFTIQFINLKIRPTAQMLEPFLSWDHEAVHIIPDPAISPWLNSSTFLTRNDLWQLINSPEYKPLSKEVLTNLHFFWVPTQAIFSSFWQEKYLRKMQQTVLRSMGNVFQISAPTYIKQLFLVSNMNFLSPHRCTCNTGCPDTWVPPHSLSPHFWASR